MGGRPFLVAAFGSIQPTEANMDNAHPDNFKGFWTVWRFKSPSSGEQKIVARAAAIDDARYQHEYQRVLGQVWANTPEQAIAKVISEQTEQRNA